MSGLGWGDEFILDGHWTMSCGNDAIDGHVSVPEPATLPLLGLGFLGFALRKRSKA
ncbi:MAG: PEP-CTERM sorting domain-containing protein [Gammaproteobacteria bacterium]|nr:PEP-CTERM sorting domain-containing protein [Gammaproteobacteria bacterium]